MDFGGKIGKFTKIIGKIHGSRKKKRSQSRITGKIKDSNSRFTKKIKLNSRITEKIRGGQFTVHEENKTQFTVHSKNKSPITVHGNTSLRPSYMIPSRDRCIVNVRFTFFQCSVFPTRKMTLQNKINKAIRDGKYLAPPHASAWQRSPH